jgi:hypothetical protein
MKLFNGMEHIFFCEFRNFCVIRKTRGNLILHGILKIK